MSVFLRSLFRLYPGEAWKVVSFAVLGALIQAGIAIGTSAGDSLFLVNLGVEKLPYIYLLIPIAMLLYTPFSSFLISRFGIDATLMISLLMIAAGSASAPILISHFGGTPGSTEVLLLYSGLKLFTMLWYLSLYTLFWNYVDQYFDIQDAKRLFSLLAAGAACGAALGGALVSNLTNYMRVEETFFVWAGLSALTIPLLAQLKRSWKKLEVEELAAERPTSILAEAKSVVEKFTSSRYAMLLAVVLFCTMNLTLLCEYQYYEIFSKNKSEQELAALIGQLFCYVSIGNIVINLFFFNRLTAWIGVRNTAVIQPVAYLVTFGVFLARGDELAGYVGFFVYHGLLTSIDYNNSNFLLNALPTEGKKQLRTFIEGMCEPLANAVTGVLLLSLVKLLAPEQLSVIGMLIALTTLLLVFILRGSYVSAMVINLKETWLDFSRSTKQVFTCLQPSEIEALHRRLELAEFKAGNQDEYLLAVRMLLSLDRKLGLEALLTYISELPPELNAREAGALLTEILEDREQEITQRILWWIEKFSAQLRPETIEQLAQFGLISSRVVSANLSRNDDESKAAAAVVHHNGHEIAKIANSLETVNELLWSTDEAQRLGLRAIGSFRLARYAHALPSFLGYASEDVRKEALSSIRLLVDESSRRLLPAFVRVIERGDEQSRIQAMDCIGKIGDSSSLAPLLQHAHSFGPAERRKAETVITNMGLRAVPIVITSLTDERFSYPARSIAARALAKLAFPQLQSLSSNLILTELRRAYGYSYRRGILEHQSGSSAGSRVLSRFYRDREQGIVEFVLEMLSLSGRVGSYELLSASLRSPNQKERANAVETIQQACNSEVFRYLGPLLDPRRASDKTKLEKRLHRKSKLSAENLLATALDSLVALEAAAAAQYLWDREADESQERLPSLLRGDPSSTRGKVILTLLSRNSGLESGGVGETLIERLDALSRCNLFESFPIEELEQIANRALPFSFQEGELIYDIGASAEHIFILESGSVSLTHQLGVSKLSTGASFGEAALFGAESHTERAVADGASGYLLSKEVVLSRARASVQVASALLARKLEVTYVQ